MTVPLFFVPGELNNALLAVAELVIANPESRLQVQECINIYHQVRSKNSSEKKDRLIYHVGD